MEKTSQKVTKDKDPKRIDGGRKGRENFMKKMIENILNHGKGSGDTTNSSNETTCPNTSATNNSSNETTRVTNTATTRSNNIYVYGVGIRTFLTIWRLCIFYI